MPQAGPGVLSDQIPYDHGYLQSPKTSSESSQVLNLPPLIDPSRGSPQPAEHVTWQPLPWPSYAPQIDLAYPFRVPMEYYQKDKRVKSIMLEVNRALYLDGDTNNKSSDYNKTKEVVQGFLAFLRKNS